MFYWLLDRLTDHFIFLDSMEEKNLRDVQRKWTNALLELEASATAELSSTQLTSLNSMLANHAFSILIHVLIFVFYQFLF